MTNDSGFSQAALRSLQLSREGFDLLLGGSDGRAGSYFEQALSLDPENSYAHYGMGEVVAREDRTGEALSHYRRAVELANPQNRERFIRGLALTLLRAGCRAFDVSDLVAAERYFSEALPFCVDPALRLACHEGAARVYQANGKTEAAKREFSLAVDLLLQQLSSD